MYIEGDLPVMSNGGYNNNGFGGGWEGLIGLALVASLFGGGWGNFGGGSRGGYPVNAATQADLAAGFANSEIMSDLNDILLQNSQGFAAVQQTLCQGFSGINQSINTVGYNLNSQIAGCCCDLKGILLENRYLNERQTCDLITNQNANTQRIIDYMQNEKITALTAENTALKGRISNIDQTAAIVGALNPPARPAFIVPNPNCCYSSCGNLGFGNGVIAQ